MSNNRIEEILEQIRELDDELRESLQEQQEKVYYQLKGKKIEFEEAIRQQHGKIRENVFRYLAKSQWRHVISAPFIYSMIIPMVLLDLFLFIYQATCFRLYCIRPVKRSQYIRIDRHHLSYLNLIEKINCTYCAYGNGLFAYAREIGSVTEQYWCPIKHAVQVLGSHERYPLFSNYGDGENYRDKAKELRKQLIATD
jgi:hypothetical protein